MQAPPRRIRWVVRPPEICCLCQEPLGVPSETSSWNGKPAHRECVRIHLIQRDPAFREGEPTDAPDEGDAAEEGGPFSDDDESDFG